MPYVKSKLAAHPSNAGARRIAKNIPMPSFCLIANGWRVFDVINGSPLSGESMAKGVDRQGDNFANTSGTTTLATYPAHDVDNGPVSGLFVGLRPPALNSSGTTYISWINAAYAPASLANTTSDFSFSVTPNGSNSRSALIPVGFGESFSLSFRVFNGTQRAFVLGSPIMDEAMNTYWSHGSSAIAYTPISQPQIACNLFVGWAGIDIGDSLAEKLSVRPWELFAPERLFFPASSGVTMPTLSAATYMPGSLTSTGFRPRVTAS